MSRADAPVPGSAFDPAVPPGSPAYNRQRVAHTAHPRGEAAFPISIVSDSRLLCDGLIAALACDLDVALLAFYAAAPIADGVLRNPSSHVVLVDARVGHAATIAWLHHWRLLAPAPHVIVFDIVNDVDAIVACIEAGAGGYTLQGAPAAEVAKVIRQVQSGIVECPPEITAPLFARLASHGLAARSLRSATPAVPLTARELEVLRYVAEDCSNREIADRLFVEVRTVKHHVHNILEKLQLRHRWDAARLAAERGWLAQDEDPPRSHD